MESTHLKLRSRFSTSKPFFSFNSNHRFQNQEAPRTPPVITMNEDNIPKSDEASSSMNTWSTPATTVDNMPYHAPIVEHTSQPPMDSSSVSMPPMSSGTPSRPVSGHQELQTPVSMEDNYYAQKPYEDQFAFHGMVPDMPIGQAFTTDEAIPVFDLDSNDPSSQGTFRGYQLNYGDGPDPRRISGSSFTMSTSGPLSDMPYEDFSTAMSDAPSYCSDYPHPSNRNSWMSSTHLSPVASPRMSSQGRSEVVRTQSRGRASPSPRPSARSAPYSIEGLRNNKRWSTGSYGTMSNRRHSPFMYQAGPDMHAAHQHQHAAHQPPIQPPYLMPCQPTLQRNSMLLPGQLPSQNIHDHHRHPFEPTPAPLLSHGLFRMLQSNADAHSIHRRYAELSDPPDLFGSLSEEQSSPPEEDMNPSDPDLVPREQDLRFDGDLYTPRWVRGHGNKREGWCGICKPGRWLVLKNSAYWYDKSFSHGISAATGAPFQEPLDTRRMDGNPDVWEGLCSSCNDWIALVSNKKKGTTWFRHAYKCHSHPKAKDSAKRRREKNDARNLASSAKALKTDIHPHPSSSSSSAVHTPLSGGIPPLPTHHHLHAPHHPLLSSETYPNMI